MIFIGHAGCYSGLPNSEEAFINAVTKHHYQALECDVKQTKDGVFVMSHNDDFNGHMLANETYQELKDIVLTKERGGILYSTKLCTLERYLDICKEYDVIPVIELKVSKGILNKDTSRMQALLDVIEKKEMLRKVIFLGSQYVCLNWTRENGYDYIPCQYLVNSCDNIIYMNRCKEGHFDISINIDQTYNNNYELVKRYQDEGIKVSTFTFSQYSSVEELQKWINYGVDFVTVDVIKPSEVKEYKKDENEENKKTIKVTFVGKDNQILKVSYAKYNDMAIAPFAPIITDYEFIGWDRDYHNVKEEMVVKAQYQKIDKVEENK